MAKNAIGRGWQRARKGLKRSALARGLFARALLAFLRLVHRTNRVQKGSVDPASVLTGEPVIIALWHGRQFMVPFHSPPAVPVTALISRSGDAELNAAVLERMGVETVRGSGGNAISARKVRDKNGVGAFRALIGALERGRTVVMIADRKPRARVAGEGVVRLARASGRPIVPVAYASTRTRRFDRAWDRAVLNLPFGRCAIVAGTPIHVGPDDDVDACRERLTVALDAATSDADRLCGNRQMADASQSVASLHTETAR